MWQSWLGIKIERWVESKKKTTPCGSRFSGKRVVNNDLSYQNERNTWVKFGIEGRKIAFNRSVTLCL